MMVLIMLMLCVPAWNTAMAGVGMWIFEIILGEGVIEYVDDAVSEYRDHSTENADGTENPERKERFTRDLVMAWIVTSF